MLMKLTPGQIKKVQFSFRLIFMTVLLVAEKRTLMSAQSNQSKQRSLMLSCGFIIFKLID